MKTNLFLKKAGLFIGFFIGLLLMTQGQNVAITDDGTYSANSSAMLDVKSTNKGLLIPRVALVSAHDPITDVNKPEGLLIWNSSPSNYATGYYYWDGSDWSPVGAAVGNGLTLSGSKIELGGVLEKTTFIQTGGYLLGFDVNGANKMQINLSSTGDFEIQDNGSSAFFVGDNGDVGIGTNSPVGDLHIVGSPTLGSLVLAPSEISSGDDAQIYLAEDHDNTMSMSLKYDGGVDRLYMYGKSGATVYGPHMSIHRTTGRVGIGVASPLALLHVEGNFLMQYGAAVNEFSTDVTLGGNSDLAIPTEKAIKTYVDNNAGAGHTGSGTANYIPRWSSSTGLGNSILYQNTNKIGIGTTVPSSKLVVYGNNGLDDDVAIFEVKNNAGATVFAVYPKGVRIYVDESIVKDKAAGSRGGFAVGNISAKADEEFFRVTRDSVRVYVSETPPGAKGSRGGFAVGNITAKGTSNLMQIEKDNYFIGHSAGLKTTGANNSFFGYWAGKDNSSGSWNVFMGYYAGLSNTVGYNNAFIGNSAGKFNIGGDYNTFIGNNSGYKNTEGNYNVFLGNLAGYSNTTGNNNVSIGLLAGAYSGTADNNIYIGNWAGYGTYGTSGASGSNNTFLGVESGKSISTGHNNCLIGFKSGYKISEGTSNIAMGDSAGYELTTGNQNVMLGSGAGVKATTASSNTYLGYAAGISMNGYSNTFVGYRSGGGGNSAATTAGNGGYNVAMGSGSLYDLTTGRSNVAVGYYAGNYIQDGENNTFLGYNAGSGYVNRGFPISFESGNNGTGNVFIGHKAGTGTAFSSMSNRLVIHNDHVSSVDDVLLYGEFDNKRLQLNGNLGVNVAANTSYGIRVDYDNTPGSYYGVYATGGYAGVRGLGVGNNSSTTYGVWGEASADLYNRGVYGKASGGNIAYGVYGYASGATTNYAGYFSGNINVTGSVLKSSDIRLKKNIEKISGAVGKLMLLNGVTYDWKSQDEMVTEFGVGKGNIPDEMDAEERFNYSEEKQVGVIAQDVEKVFPELVSTDGSGIKSVNYDGIIPILIEAIKEQQQQIDNQNKEIEKLKSALLKSSVSE